MPYSNPGSRAADVSRGGDDFGDQFLAAVDERDDIGEIADWP